jgi:hypothetical protein
MCDGFVMATLSGPLIPQRSAAANPAAVCKEKKK